MDIKIDEDKFLNEINEKQFGSALSEFGTFAAALPGPEPHTAAILPLRKDAPSIDTLDPSVPVTRHVVGMTAPTVPKVYDVPAAHEWMSMPLVKLEALCAIKETYISRHRKWTRIQEIFAELAPAIPPDPKDEQEEALNRMMRAEQQWAQELLKQELV
jgi:hypothetical protein